MSLSLDDVRNIKFRMAKRSGYEVLDVDEFVDQVEEAFAQMQEENGNLKRQVHALKQSAPAAEADTSEPATAPAAGPTPAPKATESGVPIVVTTSKEASTAVVRLVELSTDQAERLVAEAEAEAARIKADADRSAHQVTTDARTRAERVESEAQVHADRVRSDAQRTAEALDSETAAKRSEMFGELEQQKNQLSSSVAELRRFEEAYRSNLTAHLQGQIDSVRTLRGEPDGSPALLDAGRGNGVAGRSDQPDQETGTGSATSTTPRLDALLGDQH